ncbi:MAG: PIG-L family deacetylase [Gemmatimonadetes bacterium]|nr:PIG-L family deacetylase [Gemmatimonadota bacterium]
MRRCVVAAVVFLALAPRLGAQQLAPAGTGGIAALERALRLLDQNKRVLVVGAHPDDEDTELLTLLSRGLGVEAAYLSLSRGEGGQNLIGAELGEALGLIRTGELVAARALDGGRQFFTRGFDFGYSRSLEETLRFWPRDSLLADIVRVVRRFRPQILVTIWSGTPRDGHGQHQTSGVLARQVFELLRDSAWGPRKLYRTTRFDTAATTLSMPSGTLDPVAGQSYHQIAMAGRSLHRSQDMGQIQGVGPSAVRLALLEEVSGETRTRGGDGGVGLFAGIDTALGPGLTRYAALIDSARAALRPAEPARIVPILAAALGEVRRAAPPPFRAAKERLLEEALATAAGVVVDATADDGRIVPAQGIAAALTVWNAGAERVRVGRVSVATPDGWSVQALGPPASPVEPGALATQRFVVAPPEDASPSEPYFLARPRRAGLYDWSAAPEEVRGEPFAPPLVSARVELSVVGTELVLERQVSHRFGDQASGEVRRPLAVVPAVGVVLEPEVLVWPVGAPGSRAVTVTLTHGGRGRTTGEVGLELPPGWPPVAAQPFALEGEERRGSFVFAVRAPPGLRPGSYPIRAVATAGGARYDRATLFVDYPHIRPVAYAREAAARVEAAALALPRLRRIGYVRGASDVVPEALAAVGLPVVTLTPADLERADLAPFDAIVIGSRAYETDAALVANNGRLLDYARQGGRLIVQYQQYQFVRGRFAPFPLTIAAPHDRVADEASPVRILEPAHALFRTPNAIVAADWEGWTQERGLYFAREWDAAYRPLLEMGDAGERLRGGLLVARLGSGLYVYTGLAFFRELPAGVAGAYRLFANLLALRPGDIQ